MTEVAIMLIALGAAGAIAYLIASAPKRAVRKTFARLPLTTIGAVQAPGTYRLSGVATPLGEPPVSEASGRPYLIRDLWVQASTAGDESSSRRSGQQFVDFLLDDGTGTIVVHAAGGTILIDRDFQAPKTTLDQLPWVDAFLRANHYYNGSPKSCKITLREGVLAPGARVGVVGYVVPAHTAAGTPAIVRSQGTTRVMIRPEPPVSSD